MAVADDLEAVELGVLAERAARVRASILDGQPAVPGPCDHDVEAVDRQRQPRLRGAGVIERSCILPGHGPPSLATGPGILVDEPAPPDLVACWLYRVDPAGRIEILLIRRAPGRMYPASGNA